MAATSWLLESAEPWTRYRALLDLEGRTGDDSDVRAARDDMVAGAPVRDLVATAGAWPGYPLKRHNDAMHPLYAISTLADFGLTRSDPGMDAVSEAVMGHHDGEGFETLLWLPRFLTKAEEDSERWAWMLCDAPTLLYALLAFGHGDDARVRAAVDSLAGRAEDNGWRCGASTSVPSFGGPGRVGDTCPMATVYALKALSLTPLRKQADVVGPGVEAVLSHWQHQRDYKLRMFGVGSDFRKLKYPFVWYDILHVTDVLSRYPAALADPRFAEMVDAITSQADTEGRFTAGSMYRSWKTWSFADKRQPSPWLTFLVRRIEARLAAGSSAAPEPVSRL